MGPLETLNHLLNFVAPAAALALVLVPLSRVLMPKTAPALSWWAQAAIIFISTAGHVAVQQITDNGRHELD